MRGLWLAAALVLTSPSLVHAHDIPADVTIQAFLAPRADRARLLVRVPLEALRDLSVPTLAGGSIDLPRLRPLLAGAATVWIAQNVELFEDDRPLPAPSVLDLRVSLPTDRSFGSWDSALAHVIGPELP